MVKRTKVEGRNAFTLAFDGKKMTIVQGDDLYAYIESALKIPEEKRHQEGSCWEDEGSWYATFWNESGRHMNPSDFFLVFKALSEGDPTKPGSPVPVELVAAGAANKVFGGEAMIFQE